MQFYLKEIDRFQLNNKDVKNRLKQLSKILIVINEIERHIANGILLLLWVLLKPSMIIPTIEAKNKQNSPLIKPSQAPINIDRSISPKPITE